MEVYISTFLPSVPTGLVKLNIDYKAIQLNFNQINNTYQVDHVPLTDNSGVPPAGTNGMHTVVHLVTQVGDPATNAASGEVYVKQGSIGTDKNLFYKSAGGGVSQLTGSSSGTNGYSFITSNVIQWGFQAVTSTVSNATCTFATPFPNNLYNVTVTLVYSNPPSTPSGTATQIYVNQAAATFTKLGFQYTLVTNSGSLTGFFFQAIGN